MKKRLLSALLSGALLGTLFLGGCGSGETQTQNSTETAASTAVSESEGKTYRGNDVSEPVTIKMYLIGDRTPDFDLVYEEVNKKTGGNRKRYGRSGIFILGGARYQIFSSVFFRRRFRPDFYSYRVGSL